MRKKGITIQKDSGFAIHQNDPKIMIDLKVNAVEFKIILKLYKNV